MESNISLWKIKHNISYTNDMKHLLKSETSEYDNFEKTIYDIVSFHMQKKNIELNNNHNIEFSIISEWDNFKIDYCKENKKYPVLSILTFLDDNINPIIFTDICLDEYKYKEIPIDNKFVCIRPNKDIQIVFDSSKYYGFYKNSENVSGHILKINIWENKRDDPLYISNYDNIYELYSIIPVEQYVYESIYFKNIIESFLYEENVRFNKLDEIILKYSNILIIVDNISSKYTDISILENKYGEIGKYIFDFLNDFEYNEEIKNNCLYRNKIIKNMLSKDVCYWIINEYEKQEADISKYENYSTYLNIEKTPSLFNFIYFVSNYWMIELQKLYTCENVSFNITDIFISKFTNEKVSDVKNIDGSFLTINIYLNDYVDYMNGDIIFHDSDQSIKLNQGDCLIYNGKKPRTKGSVTNGVKYILVLFIDIIL